MKKAKSTQVVEESADFIPLHLRAETPKEGPVKKRPDDPPELTEAEKVAKEIAKKLKQQEEDAVGSQASQGHLHMGEPLYWEMRYKEEFAKLLSNWDTFDWYCPFDLVWPIVDSVVDITVQHRILIIGCGRSNIIEFLYKKGFRSIVCIDVSGTLISKVSSKYSAFHGVEFYTMDARNMSGFNDKSFSLIIDKGTMDALFCGIEFRTECRKMFDEVLRVLEDEGNFLSISHAAPLTRVPYLRQTRWAVDCTKVPEGETITMYTLTRTEDEAALNKRVVGGEAALPGESHNKGVVSKDQQGMNMNSTTKQAGGGGQLTVTLDPNFLANLVSEMAGDDS